MKTHQTPSSVILCANLSRRENAADAKYCHGGLWCRNGGRSSLIGYSCWVILNACLLQWNRHVMNTHSESGSGRESRISPLVQRQTRKGVPCDLAFILTGFISAAIIKAAFRSTQALTDQLAKARVRSGERLYSLALGEPGYWVEALLSWVWRQMEMHGGCSTPARETA